jgi:predicted metallopeptidase
MLDMPTPIKAILPDYKMYENRLMAVIAEKFEFEFPFDPEIKIIDKELLHIEWDNLVDKNNMEFKCLTALQAKKEFLRMYYELIK